MEERRRVPRHEVGDPQALEGLRGRPRLLSPGSRGSLRFTLAGAPFLADIQVRRVTPGSDAGSGYRIGATFVGMTLEHRQLIERFMNND